MDKYSNLGTSRGFRKCAKIVEKKREDKEELGWTKLMKSKDKIQG